MGKKKNPNSFLSKCWCPPFLPQPPAPDRCTRPHPAHPGTGSWAASQAPVPVGTSKDSGGAVFAPSAASLAPALLAAGALPAPLNTVCPSAATLPCSVKLRFPPPHGPLGPFSTAVNRLDLTSPFCKEHCCRCRETQVGMSTVTASLCELGQSPHLSGTLLSPLPNG